MIPCSLICLLLVSLSWGQAVGLESALAQQGPAPTATAPKAVASDQDRQGNTSNGAADTPLITINGLCDHPPADKTAGSSCQTVVTQAQFEKVVAAIQSKMSTKARREFAETYAKALVMARKAEQMGLDKGENYEEQLKFARIQILSNAFKKAIQEKVAQISDGDIEDYYHNNEARFEKAEIDRIYVPRTRQLPAGFDKKPGDAGGQELSQAAEETMKKEADNLHARAVAGEEFAKLQADAYRVAGITSAAPNTSIAVRRVSLPPSQVSVMDLKLGEVSMVFADSNAYVIYKVKSKNLLPLDQTREEIKATLRAQRMQDEMRAIEDAPTIDPSYFLRSRQSPGMTKTGEPVKATSKPDPNNKPD
jgi:hypothetical protein